MVGFQVFPKLKENNKQNEISGPRNKRELLNKKNNENLWDETLFCQTKTSDSADKKLLFFLCMKAGFTSVSVPKQSHKAQYLLPPKFEQKKSVSF